MTMPDPSLSEQDLQDLSALADGSVDDARRAEIEALVKRSPVHAAALERQRAAVSATRSIAIPAPARLHAGLRARHVAPPERARWRVTAVAAAAAAAAALAVAILSPAGEPSLSDVAAYAARRPTAPAPRPAGDKVLSASNAGLSFPDWGAKFGWRPTGTRADDLDGRRAVTVYYQKDGRRIAYTIVGGDALELPERGRTTMVEGTPVTAVDVDDRAVVTWKRRGHTCVLSGAAAVATLRDLAGWKGKGAVPF